jgi:hypothetical protein
MLTHSGTLQMKVKRQTYKSNSLFSSAMLTHSGAVDLKFKSFFFKFLLTGELKIRREFSGGRLNMTLPEHPRQPLF